MIEINSNSSQKIADWVELNCILFGHNISKSVLMNILEENQIDNYEIKSTEVLNIIKERVKLYGSESPIDIRGNVVFSSIEIDTFPAYSLALYFSYFGGALKDIGTKLFERAIAEVLKEYLKGEALTLGFPSDVSFKEEVDNIAILLNERRGSRSPEPMDKDRGVDVIGWKPFFDDRTSQIIVLLQAASGWNWRRKKQIPINAWNQFINWNQDHVIQGIGIAEIIQNDKWNNVIDEYSLIIDRVRIYRLNKLLNGNFSITLQQEITEWLSDKI